MFYSLTTPTMLFSIVIPTLNEAETISHTLQGLQSWRARGHELILVDGGSTDDTVILAAPLVDRLLHSTAGRALQMNTGAKVASGELLLFLHADTHLPADAECHIVEGLRRQHAAWGRFDLHLSGTHPLLRVIEYLINLRSRWSGIATGDQAMFVLRPLFEQVQGFLPIPLMEDVALSKTLKAHSRPVCLKSHVISSSRRWERHGIVRTVLLMWRLRLGYALGADPARLATQYRPQHK